MGIQDPKEEVVNHFSSAYSIKNRAVGHLDMDRAVKSERFVEKTKELANKFRKYSNK